MSMPTIRVRVDFSDATPVATFSAWLTTEISGYTLCPEHGDGSVNETNFTNPAVSMTARFVSANDVIAVRNEVKAELEKPIYTGKILSVELKYHECGHDTNEACTREVNA